MRPGLALTVSSAVRVPPVRAQRSPGATREAFLATMQNSNSLDASLQEAPDRGLISAGDEWFCRIPQIRQNHSSGLAGRPLARRQQSGPTHGGLRPPTGRWSDR
jgi:hypothetical protein